VLQHGKAIVVGVIIVPLVAIGVHRTARIGLLSGDRASGLNFTGTGLFKCMCTLWDKPSGQDHGGVSELEGVLH
jgi:hypothetical protein